MSRQDVGGGWWEGELNGVRGLFPEKYTERVNPRYDFHSLMCKIEPPVRSESTMSRPVPVPRNIERTSVPPPAPETKRVFSRNPMLVSLLSDALLMVQAGPQWEQVSDPFTLVVKTNAKKGRCVAR